MDSKRSLTVKSAYAAFFLKSADGQEFVEWIENQIERYHEQAEGSPEDSRDLSQRAKGLRDVLNHIQGVIHTGGEPMQVLSIVQSYFAIN